jgi:beta-glucosidase
MPKSIGRADTFTIRVRVTNAGQRDGDEVPQLYIRPRVAGAVTGKRLLAYRRVHLAAGASEVVEFSLPASALAVLDPQNRWTLATGVYEVLLGASSSGEISGTFTVADTANVALRTAASH